MSNKGRGEELQKHHNDGQADSAGNNYNLPHTINPWDRVVYGDQLVDKLQEDNAAYRSGWTHQHDQK